MSKNVCEPLESDLSTLSVRPSRFSSQSHWVQMAIRLYLNGVWVKAFPHFDLSCKNFSGQLVMGNRQRLTTRGKEAVRYSHIQSGTQHLKWSRGTIPMWSQEQITEGIAKDGVRALYLSGNDPAGLSITAWVRDLIFTFPRH